MRRSLTVLGAALVIAAVTLVVAHAIGDASLGGRRGGSEVMLAGGALALVTWLVGVGMYATALFRGLVVERPGTAAAKSTAAVVLGLIVAAIWSYATFALAILLSEGCCA